MKKQLHLILLSALFLSNCAAIETKIAEFDKWTNELKAEREKEIYNGICEKNEHCVYMTTRGHIYIGMPEKALYEVWGTPNDTNTSVFSFGIHKQCVYEGFSGTRYVYIENGYVTGWQR